MYKIAAIGDGESIYGFAALGLDVFPVTEPKKAVKTIRRMANSNYAVIYITESLAAQIPEEIDRYRDSRIPAIILIPGVRGNTGAGLSEVSKSVEKAVGSDILS